MKLIEKFIKTFLRKDSQGRTLYYPWGDFSPSFLVDSSAKEKKIRNFLYVNLTYLVLFFGTLILFIITGHFIPSVLFFFIVFTAPIYLLWMEVYTYYLTKNLQKTQKRPGYFEFLKKRALTTNIIFLILYFLMVVYFLVAQIQKVILDLGRPWIIADYIYHGFFLGIFIWAIFMGGCMLFIRIFKK